ncbi:MAG TPA: hypothetical protein VFA27_09555 [Vicinamibacterales bacterium]|nr:hypothetical protein [Vicinamibacterales bacterium]
MFVLISFALAHLLAAELPLTVDHIVTGPNSHVTLTNGANQPVTAWALAVTTHPDPGRTHREIETVDGYLSAATHGIAGAPERLERLMPGQSREIALDPLPDGATVDVVAVILDDGTAMGDEAVLAPMFARRAKERDALGAVSQTFADVLASQHGAAALDTLRARLDALPNRDEVPCRAAIDAVDTYKQRVTDRTPAQIDESLRTYAAFVTREWELAKKAATRK